MKSIKNERCNAKRSHDAEKKKSLQKPIFQLFILIFSAKYAVKRLQFEAMIQLHRRPRFAEQIYTCIIYIDVKNEKILAKWNIKYINRTIHNKYRGTLCQVNELNSTGWRHVLLLYSWATYSTTICLRANDRECCVFTTVNAAYPVYIYICILFSFLLLHDSYHIRLLSLLAAAVARGLPANECSLLRIYILRMFDCRTTAAYACFLMVCMPIVLLVRFVCGTSNIMPADMHAIRAVYTLFVAMFACRRCL